MPITGYDRGKKKWHLGVQVALLSALGLLTLVVIGVAWAYWMWSSVPAYWTARQDFIQHHSLDDLTAMGEGLEKRFAALWNRAKRSADLGMPVNLLPKAPGEAAADVGNNVTPADNPNGLPNPPLQVVHIPDKPGVVLVHIRPDEANAWLATRLPQWLANRNITMPPEVHDPMLAVQDGQIVLAFQYQSPRLTQVVSVSFDVTVQADGKARLNVNSVRGGDLRIPMGTVTDQMRARAEGEMRKVLRNVQTALDGQPFDPVMYIKEEHRKVRLLGVRVYNDSLDLIVKAGPMDR